MSSDRAKMEFWIKVFCLFFLQPGAPADTTVATRLEPALALQAVNTEGTVVQTIIVSSCEGKQQNAF